MLFFSIFFLLLYVNKKKLYFTLTHPLQRQQHILLFTCTQQQLPVCRCKIRTTLIALKWPNKTLLCYLLYYYSIGITESHKVIRKFTKGSNEFLCKRRRPYVNRWRTYKHEGRCRMTLAITVGTGGFNVWRLHQQPTTQDD